MWVRGLKHAHLVADWTNHEVASYVGAWIETSYLCRAEELDTSHPMWVRGLKLHYNKNAEQQKRRILCGCVD